MKKLSVFLLVVLCVWTVFISFEGPETEFSTPDFDSYGPVPEERKVDTSGTMTLDLLWWMREP